MPQEITRTQIEKYTVYTGPTAESFSPIMAGITYPDPAYEILVYRRPLCVFEYVLSGRGHIERNGSILTVNAGDAYILTAGTYHHYYSDKVDPWTKIWFNVSGSLVQHLLSDYGLDGVTLIPRFYDATEGTVEIMGRDARNYPREELRGKAAMVMQKAQLFGGTIRSNLLWGNKNATDADLWAALETAQAAEFVKAKPLGLDEPVEQGGRNLSGGQKQRLTIARALVGKPEILILDDSASALDYATDAALRKALAALPGSLTVFIVSQRAASLQHADQILVLDDGHLVGIGTHDQLRQTCPVYEEIYESQFKKGDAQK